MENGNNIFLENVNSLRECLKGKETLADAGMLASLDKDLRNLEAQYDEIMNKDRNLKIGIVGRVKAGKSSFLNALLFEGQERLPKAATPMTAALTRISYTPEKADQCAIVHYYNDEDWRLIENNSNKLFKKIDTIIQHEEEDHRTNFRFKEIFRSQKKLDKWKEDLKREILSSPSIEIEELKNCQELVSLAQKKGVSYKSLPHSRDKKDEYCVPLSEGDNNSFFEQLNDFVGADGKYTAFVKYIELKINDERLSGIEVVDTPGLNDPVTSRVDVTNRFLKECDAVLLLSGVSHFLDSNDADLVKKQIREASIGRVYIIGTMLDVGLMECPRRKADLQEAMDISRSSYTASAKDFLNVLKKSNCSIPKGMEDDPILVSSVFYAIARKMRSQKSYNIDEKHVLYSLGKNFPDYQKYLQNADDFEDLSGFAEVKENVYVPIRNDKEKILTERLATFQNQQVTNIIRYIDDLIEDTERRQSLLDSNDIAELKAKQALINDNLQKSKIQVRNIFDEINLNCKRNFNDLKINMREQMNGFRNIHVESETKSRTWTTTKWLIVKDSHYEIYTEHKASANEVANNIEDYGQQCCRLISTAFAEIIRRDSLERKLNAAIYDTFQAAQADSSAADIRSPVQSLLKEIEIPAIDYSGTDEAKKRIFDSFSSEVRDSDIEKLKTAQSEQLEALYKDNVEKCDNALLKVSEILEKSGNTFIDKVCGKVNDSYNTLQSQLADKDKNIRLYQEFSRDMKNMKEKFMNLGD